MHFTHTQEQFYFFFCGGFLRNLSQMVQKLAHVPLNTAEELVHGAKTVFNLTV